MHGGSPRSGRTTNGVSDANDTITYVAARQRLFIIVLHRTSVSDQLAMITPLTEALTNISQNHAVRRLRENGF
ncbi:hypothetical protein GCM10020219_007770 [Nonomuraea dietziae]